MEVSGQLRGPVALRKLGKQPPNTHCIGRWMGRSADLDATEEEKILPLSGIEPGRPARIPLLYRISALCKLHYYENKIVSHIALNISIPNPYSS
jgi:hypothetical protein